MVESQRRLQCSSFVGKISEETSEVLADAMKGIIGSNKRRTDLRCSSTLTENQTLPKISVPLVPPKPKEFFTATLIVISRAAFAQ